jgi:hypothetical protein
MTTTAELFPMTAADKLAAIRVHLVTESEKAEEAVARAEAKVADCHQRLYMLNEAIEAMERSESAGKREAVDQVTGEIMQAAVDIVNSGACDVEGLTVTAEVTAPDSVVAVYVTPDGEDPVATVVGEHTTYGELTADYAAATGFDGALTDLAVISEEDGMPRRHRDVIAPVDHGCRLLVVVLEDSEMWQQCPACDGDGHQPDKSGGGHHGVCPACNGVGVVEREDG